ncbi:hypothetical protein RI129_001823 [Pyrocoelia pectoralis]|uniref:DDE Tnp4 domain-containing protein n=1 Tax=Pyrocoelia pectoralis TaxID=417401 RepID=A0AAN7W0H2_9COLE
MVLLTLRYLATGSILQVVGDFINVDKATASRVITKVIRSIARLHPQFIKMPSTPQELNNVKQGFFNISRFPRCIGALDCSHIKIISPGGQNPEIFRNRKLFFSFNIQAVCDSTLKVQDIVCRWPGSSHDSTIFKNSRLRARMENREFGEDSILLGDSGYAVKKYLITPLQNPQTRAEHLFNESQIRTRNPIERCFGVIKRRFPVLAIGIRLNIQKVEAIVVACSVLHNIACMMNEPELEVTAEIEAAIEFANGINLDLGPQWGNGVNGNNIVRFNLINEYFLRLL